MSLFLRMPRCPGPIVVFVFGKTLGGKYGVNNLTAIVVHIAKISQAARASGIAGTFHRCALHAFASRARPAVASAPDMSAARSLRLGPRSSFAAAMPRVAAFQSPRQGDISRGAVQL
jgi:hypothetical protein